MWSTVLSRGEFEAVRNFERSDVEDATRFDDLEQLRRVRIAADRRLGERSAQILGETAMSVAYVRLLVGESRSTTTKFSSTDQKSHWKRRSSADTNPLSGGVSSFDRSGAAYRTRTCDPRITNAMLYQLS